MYNSHIVWFILFHCYNKKAIIKFHNKMTAYFRLLYLQPYLTSYSVAKNKQSFYIKKSKPSLHYQSTLHIYRYVDTKILYTYIISQ